MNDTVVTSTNNKKYIKIDEYKALFIKEKSNENVEYKKRLIDYDKNYESYDLYQD